MAFLDQFAEEIVIINRNNLHEFCKLGPQGERPFL